MNTLLRFFFIGIEVIVQHQIHGIAFQGRNALGNAVHHFLYGIALHHLCLHGQDFLVEFLTFHAVHDLILQMGSGIPAASFAAATALLPQHLSIGEIVPGDTFSRPDFQENIHSLVCSFLSDMSHSGNTRRVKSGLVEVVKACDTEVLRCRKSHLGRCFAYRYRHIIIDTDNGIRQLFVGVPQMPIAFQSALVVKGTVPDVILIYFDLVFFGIVKHSLQSAAALIIAVSPHQQPEFFAVMHLMHMCDHLLHSRIIVNAHIIKVFQFVGNGDYRKVRLLRLVYYFRQHCRGTDIIQFQKNTVELRQIRKVKNIIFCPVISGISVPVAGTIENI